MKHVAAACALLTLSLLPGVAHAERPGKTHVSAGVNAFQAHEQQAGPSSIRPADPQPASHVPGHYVTTTACASGAETACHDPGNCPGGVAAEETYFQAANGDITDDTFTCPGPETPSTPPPPQLTPGMIEEAFQRIPLPAPPLKIQPSGGRTIVNFPTIAYTTAGADLTRTVTLLGHRITFTIHPATFTWHWGDGAISTTDHPGAPYAKTNPSLRGDITHKYETKSTFAPRLDTTYTAVYSVDGKPTLPVHGTVTIHGAPQRLTADTYTPVLVSH